jgi:hypothetical protein
MNMNWKEGRGYGVVHCDIIQAFTRNLYKRLKKNQFLEQYLNLDLSNMKQKRPPHVHDVSRAVLPKKVFFTWKTLITSGTTWLLDSFHCLVSQNAQRVKFGQ